MAFSVHSHLQFKNQVQKDLSKESFPKLVDYDRDVSPKIHRHGRGDSTDQRCKKILITSSENSSHGLRFSSTNTQIQKVKVVNASPLTLQEVESEAA